MSAINASQFRREARDFINYWRIERPHGRDLYRLDEVRNMDPHFVWTVQYDPEDGSQHAVPGINFIYGAAVVGYVTALRRWDDPEQRGPFAPPYAPDDPYQAPTKGGIRSIDFENHWGVVRRKDGKLFEYNDLLGQSIFHVWTVVRNGSAGQVAFPGIHRIQRMVEWKGPVVTGYLLTKRPCFSEQVHAVVMGPRERVAESDAPQPEKKGQATTSHAPLSQWGIKPVKDGRLLTAQEAQYIDKNHLWTIVYDSETGRRVAQAGGRLVASHALGFVQTERAWSDVREVADFAPPYKDDEAYQAPLAGTLSQSDFEQHWGVTRRNDGGLLSARDVLNHSIHHIWKVVDDGQGGHVALPGMTGDWQKGYGYVKGYILTDRPWMSEELRAVVDVTEQCTEAQNPLDSGPNPA